MEAEKLRKEPAEPTMCTPLSHPMRVRILELVNEHPMSPVQFINAGFAPGFETKQQALSYVSYHFRELEKAKCIEVVALIPRRGAVEHVYGGKARVYFTDEEFARMPLGERQQLSRTSFQGLVARTDGAMRTGTFDKRTDRHLTWRAMNLDERGWKEILGRLGECFQDCERIRQDAEDRLASSGEKVVPATMAMLAFESPPPPPLP